ncbi:MAG: hypothetical protein AAFX99_08530, partial [Myxococcota bacterium]
MLHRRLLKDTTGHHSQIGWLVVLMVFGASACSDGRTSTLPDPISGSNTDSEPTSDRNPCTDDNGQMPLAVTPPTTAMLPDLNTPEPCPSGQRHEQGLCLPTLPTQPEPMAEPCPQGWSSTADLLEQEQASQVEEATGLRLELGGVCIPPEQANPCPTGQMMVLGQGCMAIGMACPEGNTLFHDEQTLRMRTTQGLTHPQDPASPYPGQLWYVAAEAEPGGQGSYDAPFATIGHALEAAHDGDIIALGPGEFTEAFEVTKQVALVGSCVQRTTLQAPDAQEESAVVRVGAREGVWLSDVTITGERPGIHVEPSAEGTVHLQSLVIHHTTRLGLWVEGAQDVRAADVVIAHTQPQPSDSTFGRGISVQEGAVLEGQRMLLTHNHDQGLIVDGEGTRAKVTDIIITHTQLQPSNSAFGRGITVQNGAVLEGQHMLLAHNHDVGLIASAEGTRAQVADVIIIHTQPSPFNPNSGVGAVAHQGAVLEGQRLLFTHNHEMGLFVGGAGTQARLDDLVIAHTQPRPSLSIFGRGISVQEGAVLEGQRMLLTHNHEMGIFVSGTGTQARVDDLTITHTQPQRLDSTFGRGINVERGAVFESQRALLTYNHEISLFISREATRARLDDLVITHSQPSPLDTTDTAFSRGISVQQGAALHSQRALLTHNHAVGLIVSGAQATVGDLIVAHTQPSNLASGVGVIMQREAVLEGERILLTHNHEMGLCSLLIHEQA